MKTPSTTWRRCEDLAAERNALGVSIQKNIEAITADFALLSELSASLAAASPVPASDVYSWALSPNALQNAIERAFSKAGFPNNRYSPSQHSELSTFSLFVSEGSLAVTQRKAAA